jgi:hypothetical protein
MVSATAGIGRCLDTTYPSSIAKAVILLIPLRMKTLLSKIRPNSGMMLVEGFDMRVLLSMESMIRERKWWQRITRLREEGSPAAVGGCGAAA